jgi:hypothetical protein
MLCRLMHAWRWSSPILYVGIVFAALCLFPLRVCAGISINSKNYFEPSEALVTPHIKWAKPYYGGKVRALFIIPRAGMREVAELAQRIDMDYRVFVTEGDKVFAKKNINADSLREEDASARHAMLEELLSKEYDIYIIGSIDWSILPQDAKLAILRGVKNGAGLVGIINGRDEILNTVLSRNTSEADKSSFAASLNGFPYQSGLYQVLEESRMQESQTAFADAAAQIVTFGKGRICLYKYQVPSGQPWASPFHVLVPGPSKAALDRDLTDYDYQLGLVIRCMLWAAGKNPAISISNRSAYISSIYGTPVKAEFNTSNNARIDLVDFDFFVLNNSGEKIFEKQGYKRLGHKDNLFSFALQTLPIGKYRANLIIGKNGKIINFATNILEITGALHIQSLDINRNAFCSSEQVSGTVRLNNPPQGSKILVRHFDNYERLLHEKIFNAKDGVISFGFSLEKPLTVMQYLKVALVDHSGNIIQTKSKHFTVSDLHPANDDMRIIVWNNRPKLEPFYTVPILKYWRKNGVDTTYVSFDGCGTLANMWQIPILDRLVDEKTDWCRPNNTRSKNDLVRKPCLTNPEYRNSLRKMLASKVEKMKEYSMHDFSLGDECLFVVGDYDLCFSDTCRADFKRFVKEEYGTIEKLNTEYGTTCKSFDEVEPLPFESAKEQDQIAGWVDHRLHMDSIWAGIFDFCRDSIRGVAPGARVGYEGSNLHVDSYSAGDYWKLSRAMNLNNIYYQPFQAAALASFASKGDLLGFGWIGGYGAPHAKKHNYETQYRSWLTLFKGGNSLWVWNAGGPSSGSVSAPEYEFYDYFQDALSAVREMKAGLGKALIRAERQADFGIYYSPASIHTAKFMGTRLGNDAHLQDISQLTIDLGFQPFIYSPEQVKGGMLLRNKPKAVYMSFIQSISMEEAEALKKYVAGGGVLIADICPGVRNAHGKLLQSGLLNNVFGISGSTGNSIKQGELVPDGIRLVGRTLVLPYDSGVSLNGGRAAGRVGDAPAIIHNSYGKGRAVLLNFSIEGYIPSRVNWPENQYAALMRSILANLEIFPDVKTGTQVPGLEVTRFKSGGLQYITFLQDIVSTSIELTGSSMFVAVPDKKPVTKFTATMPSEGYVYNVRDGKYMGKGRQAALGIKVLEPAVLAVVPYKIEGISLSAVPGRVEQGQKLRYSIKVNSNDATKIEEQIVRIQFINPRGQEVEHYGGNIPVTGSAEQEQRLALNEAPGIWTIVARDLISGSMAKTCFIVGGTKR